MEGEVMGSGEGGRRKRVQVRMRGMKRGRWEREGRSKGGRQKRRKGQCVDEWRWVRPYCQAGGERG